MTREEAIAHGKEQLNIFGGEHREFIKMAIKALDSIDEIRTEIDKAYCKVTNDYDRGRNYGLYIATQIIDKYNAESEEQNMSDIELIRDFRNKINAYHKDYKFSKEEILNILERYELKYNKAVIKQKNENKK